jgi:hypothetical protein
MEYNWTDVLQGVGSIASALISIIGFIFIYFQIKQAKMAMIEQNNSALYNLGYNLHSVLLNNSHLRVYIDGEKLIDPSDKEYSKLIIIIEMIADYYEYIICEKNNIDTKITEGWVEYLRHNIKKRKLLREYILEHEKYYSKEFITEIKSITQQIEFENQSILKSDIKKLFQK